MNTATKVKIESLTETQSILKRRLQNIENSWRGGRPVWRYSDDAYEEHKELVEAIKQEIDDLDHQIIDVEMSLRDPDQDAEMRAELYGAMAMNGVHDDVSLYMHTPHQEKLFQEQIWRQVQYEDDSWAGHDYTGGNCPSCHSFDEDWISVQGEQVCYQNCYEEARGFANLLMMFMSPLYVFHESNKLDFFFGLVEDDDS